MRQEIKKLPKALQEAYKKVANRPDSNTPAIVIDFMNEDIDITMANMFNQFKVNEIVDWVDDGLLDLELDDDKATVYNDFALEVVKKVMGLINVETKKSKDLKFYDNNPKVKKLKARDFTELGDLTDKTKLEKADLFAGFYKVEDDSEYKDLSVWEKKLFADKVEVRADTNMEKK